MKKIVPCRVCGKDVAKNANKCPYCGTNTPSKEKFVAVIVALVFMMIWFAVVIAISVDRSAAADEASTSTATSKGTEELTEEEKAAVLLDKASSEFQKGDYMAAIELCNQIVVDYPHTEISANMAAYVAEQFAQFPQFSASDLMAEYESNIVNADEKYTDTIMVITGTVNSIGKTNNDKNLTVVLDSGYYFQGVQLNFKTSQTEAVAALNKGDSITAIGKCTGKSGTQFGVLSGKNVMVENCYIIS